MNFLEDTTNVVAGISFYRWVCQKYIASVSNCFWGPKGVRNVRHTETGPFLVSSSVEISSLETILG